MRFGSVTAGRSFAQIYGISDARRIGDGRPQLLPYGIRLLQQSDRVAERLRHLRSPIQPHDATGGGEERPRLGEVVDAELGVPTSRDLA